MKPLILDSSMTNMSGVFYPTGHVFALFPDEDCARQAAAALHSAGHQGELAHASPEFILQEIVRTLGGTDIPLPLVDLETALRTARAQVHAVRARPEVKAATAGIVERHGSRVNRDGRGPGPRRSPAPPAADPPQLSLEF